MSCLCGSSKCDCEEECFCFEALCGCALCKLLPKMCPHCSLPCYDSSKEYACQVCSCGKQGDSSYSEAMSGSQTTESESSFDSRVPVCHSCKLPIFLLDIGDEDEQKNKDRYCRCPQRNQIENEPMLSEHETSTSTSDHRQVSADRQVRKALSRKTRTEKSNWQAKKVKDRSSNSPEESGNNTETVSAGTLLTDTSSSHLEGQDSSYSVCATYASNADNINPDFNSPQKLSSRTDETTGNMSLLVNISGVSSQCTPEASSSQASGYKQVNIRGEFPPFPPNPIPAPPGFEMQQYPLPTLNLDEAPQPLPEQDPVERTEKMEKWFGTIQDVLNTSGELPDAETAAALDKLDKDKPNKGKPNKGKSSKGKSEADDSVEFPNYGSIPSPKGKRKGKSDTELHTDTDRSTSVSHYPIESDRIESESD